MVYTDINQRGLNVIKSESCLQRNGINKEEIIQQQIYNSNLLVLTSTDKDFICATELFYIHTHMTKTLHKCDNAAFNFDRREIRDT